MRKALQYLAYAIAGLAFLYGEYLAITVFFDIETCTGPADCRWVLADWSAVGWILALLAYLPITPLIAVVLAWQWALITAIIVWVSHLGERPPPGYHYVGYFKTVIELWGAINKAASEPLIAYVVSLIGLGIVYWVFVTRGVIGAILAVLVLFTFGNIARGIIMLVLGLLVSFAVALPASLILAIAVRIPEEDAQAEVAST